MKDLIIPEAPLKSICFKELNDYTIASGPEGRLVVSLNT